MDACLEADSFGQRSSCQGDEEESLFSKYTCVDDWDVRVVGHKPLQNVNDAVHGIIGWSEVSGDITSATADRDLSKLGTSPLWRPILQFYCSSVAVAATAF